RQALFLVYQWDLADGEIGARYGAEIDPWARELAEGTVAQAADLDSRITAASRDWPAGRPGVVGLSARPAALRRPHRGGGAQGGGMEGAGGFTKRYGSDEGAKLVNGILGRIQQEAA